MARSVDDFVIDFRKEEDAGGGNRIKVPDGWYRVKIASAKATTSDNKGTPGLEMTCLITEGKYRKKKFNETLWATPKAYRRFRTLLEACGKKVPTKVNIVRIAKAITGEELYMELEVEERDGYKPRSRVTFEGFVSVDDYDPDDEPDAGDEDDEDLDDEDADEDEDLDEDEEEEEEPPARKRRSRAKAKTSTRKRKPADDDEDDEDDLDLDDF